MRKLRNKLVRYILKLLDYKIEFKNNTHFSLTSRDYKDGSIRVAIFIDDKKIGENEAVWTVDGWKWKKD